MKVRHLSNSTSVGHYEMYSNQWFVYITVSVPALMIIQLDRCQRDNGFKNEKNNHQRADGYHYLLQIGIPLFHHLRNDILIAYQSKKFFECLDSPFQFLLSG